MQIIKETITVDKLKQMAAASFGDMIKAVVDVDKGILAVDAELHSDLEAFLIDSGSKQKSLWGINIYPEMHGEEFIEYDSMINMRPSQGNRSRGVENEEIRKKITQIVDSKIKE